MKNAQGNLSAARGLFLEYLMDDAPALNALMGDAVIRRADEFLNRIWQEHHPAKTKSGGQSTSDAQSGCASRNGGGGATKLNLKPDPRLSPAVALSPDRLAEIVRGVRFRDGDAVIAAEDQAAA